MSNDFLKVTDEAGVRTLQLNRPERKNALTTALGWGLVKAAEAAAQDDEVRVLVVSGGEPGQAFCSGADLGGASEEAAHPRSPQNQRLDDPDWIGEFLVAFRLNTISRLLRSTGRCRGWRGPRALCATTHCGASAALPGLHSRGHFSGRWPLLDLTHPPWSRGRLRFLGIRDGSCGELRPAGSWGRWLSMTPFRTPSLARQRNWLFP